MNPGAAVIAAACGYEHVAIVTGRCPTISAITRAQPIPVRLAALSGFTVWLWIHLLRVVAEAKS